MDKELEQYYDNYFEMFDSKGWKQFVEELRTNGLSINSVEAVKDSNDLYLRKGQLNVIATVLNFEAQIQNVYEENTQEPEND